MRPSSTRLGVASAGQKEIKRTWPLPTGDSGHARNKEVLGFRQAVDATQTPEVGPEGIVESVPIPVCVLR